MRVAVIGGIFGKPADYRARHQAAPESLLADGLESRGHHVRRCSHQDVPDLSRFDVVHVHHPGSGAARAALDRGPARLVFTPHRSDLPPGVRGQAMRLVVAASDALVALSETERSWHEAALGVEPGRSRVIPNGVDEATYRFAPPPAPGEPWRLLFVGQLIPMKGVDVLLRAMSQLAPVCRMTLDLAFQVDTEVAGLARLARALGVAERVRFLGALPANELVDRYHGAHALVLPSRRTEQLPSVVTEAMLSGCPVVASDVGSVREQLAGGGALVPPDDADALARALVALFADYERHRSMAAAVRASAAARYSLGTMVDRHEALYACLCADQSPRRAQDPNSMRALMWKGAVRAWTSWKRS